MKVEIKDSNYITHINGNRPYKPSGNHFRRTFLPFDSHGYSYKEILNHVEDNDIEKANVISEYFEDVGKDREMMQNKSFKYLTLWTTACFIHAVSHAIVTQDTSFLVEEAPLIASVAGFLLSCGLTEKKLKEIADEKSQEALEVKSELRAEQKEQWDEKVRQAAEEERLKRKTIEEKFNATTDDLASTPGIEEISDPAKMAKALADVKYNAVYEFANSEYEEQVLSLPGVQELIDEQLVRIGKSKDSDYYRDNNKYRMGLEITKHDDNKSLIIHSYMEKEPSGRFDGDEYIVSPCEDNNPDHCWKINLLHREYSEYPNFKYVIVDDPDDYATIHHCSPEDLSKEQVNKTKTIYLNDIGEKVDEVVKDKGRNYNK